jgi:protein TonB
MRKFLLMVCVFCANYLLAQDTAMIPLPPPPPPPVPPVMEPPDFEAKDKVFTIVEKMPQFPGGEEALYQYLSTNIKYPLKERKKGITGKVYVSFVVNTDGGIIYTRIAKGVSKGIDDEALRVVSSMPKWIPGAQQGKPVAVQYMLPITFSLKNK